MQEINVFFVWKNYFVYLCKEIVERIMRILIVNTSEHTGGAAVAANRLMEALNNNGVKAKMLVRDKLTNDISVAELPHQLRNQLHFLWERWCIFWHLRFSKQHLFEVDMANVGSDITRLPEFKEAAISDIAEKYIEGTPQISEIPLDRDMTNAARSVLSAPKEILGDSTENLGITEGWIRFDILFHARVPKSGELITLIINVEAQRTQKRSKLGYVLLRRAVYYASRLISSQKETEFSGSSYNEIKKVYSIWLCMDSPDGKSAINRYDINEHHVLNSHKEKHTDYDLMSIVTIYLGEERKSHEDWLIRFLRLLFKNTRMTMAEKKKLLKDEFDLDTTTDIEEELSTMCNLSTGIYEQGIAQGIEQGIETNRTATVLSMLKENLPIEMIARITNLSADKIRALKMENQPS